ncbi:MAG: alpha/beta fold hydrolase [Deltaproteobacteria bacterium]|nr:alpha/beta fold hydrolase [Deltaproteobacteria bacterium]
MPKIDVKGTRLYYEAHGEGYPLVLIRGLGSNADHWYAQLPAFSRHYCVVVFDNRGIARSDPSAGPYSIPIRIPDAKSHIIERGGHQFLIEQPDVSNRIILEFLDSLQ